MQVSAKRAGAAVEPQAAGCSSAQGTAQHSSHNPPQLQQPTSSSAAPKGMRITACTAEGRMTAANCSSCPTSSAAWRRCTSAAAAGEGAAAAAAARWRRSPKKPSPSRPLRRRTASATDASSRLAAGGREERRWREIVWHGHESCGGQSRLQLSALPLTSPAAKPARSSHPVDNQCTAHIATNPRPTAPELTGGLGSLAQQGKRHLQPAPHGKDLQCLEGQGRAIDSWRQLSCTLQRCCPAGVCRVSVV